MKISSLYSSILKGTWAIEPQFMLSFSPIVTNLFHRDFDISSLEKSNEDESIYIKVFSPEGNQVIIKAESLNKKGTSIFEDAPKGSTAIIPLKGVMLKEDTYCDYGTNTISSIMLEAVSSENINSIILDIDSGGGSVDAISPMVFAIQKSQAAGKPVLALADMAASAAYYVASFTDHIMASNNISSSFGSIGVMISFQDVQPYYEKLGVKFHNVYAPESNYKHKAFNLMLKGKYEEIQKESLSPLARGFQKNVRKNRNGKINLTVPGILNGRMFFAEKAKAFGLIDTIGNIDLALEKIHQMSN